MDIDIALNYVNDLLKANIGRELRKPEKTIFKGSWQGMTYEQMADNSEYSANYLMRDIAPKFWKTLTSIFGENIGKSNFRLKVSGFYDLLPIESQGLPIQNTKKLNLRDWQNAPSIPSSYYNRESELESLQQWIGEDNCQLLKIWGLSGSGKTLLMRSLGESIQEKYEVVIWRSLALSPSFPELIEDLLYSGFSIQEKDRTQLLGRLITQMQSHSCLIMLDGIEAILQPKALGGRYLSGYEDYDRFFKVVGKSQHRSCVVVTSLENFGETATSNDPLTYDRKLSGLSLEEARSLLQEQLAIKRTEEYLVEYYQGNPAILMAIAQIIRELFNGNTREFVEQESLVFGSIDRLLGKTFNRLSVLETEILYWLAGESKPMALGEIQDEIPLSIYPVELIEALKSLMQRSLLETREIERRSVFVLLPMIREYVTNQFIAQIADNSSSANRLNSSMVSDTIELGQAVEKPTHLSQWLQNRFEPGWQPVKTLFIASGRSPARLRSAFNLRGEGVVRRFKQIKLGTKNSESVLLVVAVNQEESALKICVQVQPTFSQQILPAKLKLNLLDSAQKVLASIQAKAQDNFIQLPYFRGNRQERFKLALNLGSNNYEHEFLI